MSDESVSDWRPIETAPKDGRTILACGRWSDGAVTVQWDCGEWAAVWDGMAVIESQSDFGTEYLTADPLDWWMPLPVPPTPPEPAP